MKVEEGGIVLDRAGGSDDWERDTDSIVCGGRREVVSSLSLRLYVDLGEHPPLIP